MLSLYLDISPLATDSCCSSMKGLISSTGLVVGDCLLFPLLSLDPAVSDSLVAVSSFPLSSRSLSVLSLLVSFVGIVSLGIFRMSLFPDSPAALSLLRPFSSILFIIPSLIMASITLSPNSDGSLLCSFAPLYIAVMMFSYLIVSLTIGFAHLGIIYSSLLCVSNKAPCPKRVPCDPPASLVAVGSASLATLYCCCEIISAMPLSTKASCSSSFSAAASTFFFLSAAIFSSRILLSLSTMS